jgi:hypothetical protein
MIFLKSLLFIVWNVAVGVMLVELVRWLLFNKKSRFVFGVHIPLTPGFLIQKRDWLFNKVRAILHDYLDQAERAMHNDGYLSSWEKLVYETALNNVGFMDEWVLMPNSWKQKLKEAIAKLAEEISRRILRQFVPKLFEQLQLENRIDNFDEQFNSKALRQYYNQYIHKYLSYFIIGLNVLIGITNMILYLIIA